ncbi:hypothetical protein QBC32DRAFT_37277 [Pseudoneurospora amorphoporcata]|uniref:Uncharacterized protein n=1 Tax=Pseudoneurospora amorphoporcata TaxID=241081 RepID=A0AAN6NQV0_9PEZI|nr:hypothetical protein QBC32DRAFT_37277 [Pseudoneurospora amorphoporcata]
MGHEPTLPALITMAGAGENPDQRPFCSIQHGARGDVLASRWHPNHFTTILPLPEPDIASPNDNRLRTILDLPTSDVEGGSEAKASGTQPSMNQPRLTIRETNSPFFSQVLSFPARPPLIRHVCTYTTSRRVLKPSGYAVAWSPRALLLLGSSSLSTRQVSKIEPLQTTPTGDVAMNLHHIITPPNLLDPMMKLSNPAPLTRTPGLPLITERYCLGILQAQHTVTLSTLGQQREPWFVSMEPTFSVFHSTTIPSQYQPIIPGSCPLLPPWKPLPIRANQIRNPRSCLSKTHVPPDSSSQPASVCCFVQTTGIRALFGNTPSYYTCYCQPEILPQDVSAFLVLHDIGPIIPSPLVLILLFGVW